MIKQLSIRKKIGVILSFIIFTTSIIFGIYFFYYIQNLRLNHFYSDKETLSKISLSDVIPAVEYNDNTLLNQFFEGMCADQDFQYCIIENPDGKINFQFFRNITVKEDFKNVSLQNENILYLVKLKLHSGFQGDLGILTIAYSKKIINHEINNILFQIIFSIFFLAIIIIISLAFILEKIVIKPLDKLSKATEEISGGNLSTRININKKDEFGSLANNFNRMAANLKQHISQINEQKNETQKLQEFLNGIIEKSPNGVIAITLDGEIITINPSAKKYLNINVNLQQQRSIYKISENFEHYKTSIQDTYLKKKTIRIPNQVFIIDKKEKVFNIIFYPLISLDNSSIVIILHDISEQTFLEKQLIQSQKMEAIGTLAGGMAHDFNNILAIIQGNVSLLQFKISDKKSLQKINIIEDMANRAADLVKQILYFSRREKPEFKTIDIIDIINDVLKMGKEFFPKTISIEEDFHGEYFEIFADKGQLSQVFLNMLINARDAIEASPNKDLGIIKISIKNIYIDQFAIKLYNKLPSRHCVEIKFSDNGTGMTEEQVEKIFDPFFTTKPQGKGTGLGLSIVFGIIENHRGQIKVYSELGNGTTFSIILPKEKRKSTRKEIITKKIIEGKGNVLIVDDEKELGKVTSNILTSIGYTTKYFSNGNHAIDHFAKNPDKYDLAILDIMMPEISGINTYKELCKINNKLPVIFVSGKQDNQKLIDEFKEIYPNTHFLVKPFNIYDLSEIAYKAISF